MIILDRALHEWSRHYLSSGPDSEKQRMRAVSTGLVEQGIDCHSFDARSFGQSETNNAERGKIENFEHLVNDYLAFIDKIEQGARFPVKVLDLLPPNVAAKCVQL